MAEPGRDEVTRILEAARAGEAGAADRLFPLVHRELRRLAERAMRDQEAGHTLQPTALVNEAYLRLVDRTAPFESRAHFFGVAARSMRSILVDHARARMARKRGGGRRAAALDEALAAFEGPSIDLLALDEALEKLGARDPRKVRLVELRFFAGLSIPETAEMLGVSRATVEREWAFARAWLHREVTRGETTS